MCHTLSTNGQTSLLGYEICLDNVECQSPLLQYGYYTLRVLQSGYASEKLRRNVSLFPDMVLDTIFCCNVSS
jgi:hypothetical protein